MTTFGKHKYFPEMSENFTDKKVAFCQLAECRVEQPITARWYFLGKIRFHSTECKEKFKAINTPHRVI